MLDMIKKEILIIYAICSVFALSATTWVDSYGTKVPFNIEYITGFGMQRIGQSKSEALDSVKIQALNDLTNKVSVKISNESTNYQSDDSSVLYEKFTSISKTTSTLELSNIEYLLETKNDVVYALAYVNKGDILSTATTTFKDNLTRILIEVEESENLISAGEEIVAVKKLIKTLPIFSEALNSYSIVSTLGSVNINQLFAEFNNSELYKYSDLIELELDIKKRIDAIKKFKNSTLESALDKAAFIFNEQGIRSDEFLFPAFKYQTTDYSSSFGQYASNKLKQLIIKNRDSIYKKIIIEGTYWETGSDIELFINAVDVNGKIVGSVSVSFPKDSIPSNYKYLPVNHKQALIDLKDFNEGALSDGGIYVDVWTDKGRNEETLVYNEGDDLSLYLRVNQPCITQIAYILATGEKVLLEERFYIGIDKVNMVVEYPYQLSVVPPFGVERLIITAYSSDPPEPVVYPKQIDGETYMVYGSVKDVVSSTRGLRKKKKTATDGVRVGEAQLAITTMPRR